MIAPHATKLEGSLVSITQLPGPRPPREPYVVVQSKTGNEICSVTYQADGCLHLSVANEAGTYEVVSCPLLVTEPCPVLILARWSLPGFMELRISKDVVASSREEVVFRSYKIAARIQPNRDFGAENLAVITQRHQRFVRFQPIPSRERADDNYIIATLKAEADQLGDLLELISKGKTHHAVGLAALLRRLVGNGDPLPLIQLRAALSGQPLIVFTSPNPTFMPKTIVDGAIVFNISATPGGLNCNPIDLDVWLKMPAGKKAGKVFTHRELIVAIGNTAGAHIDVNLHPYVTMLQSLSGTAHDAEVTGLLYYLTEVGKAILPVARNCAQ